jgi:hypothetical protein
MSQGAVVVASRFGGMSEMIEDGTSGFLVDPNDLEGMASTIEQTLDSPDRRVAIRRQAKARAAQMCDYETTTRAIIASYRPPDKPRRFTPVSVPPRVSVIIPFYNQEAYLQEALASVQASDYPDVEIIVVNDGSTNPQARALFDSLDGSRVVKIDKRNGGLASARNAGLARATGKFILPLDADDLIESHYISAAVDALVNNPELAYVTCYARHFGDLDNHYVPLGLVRELMVLVNPAGKCCSLFRKSVLEELGGYDEAMISFEDWNVLCRIAATPWDGDVLPEAYFRYRRHGDSMVHQTAWPFEVPLMQYMIRQHPALLKEYGEQMLGLAVHSWITAQRMLGEQTAWIAEQAAWVAELQKARDWLLEQWQTAADQLKKANERRWWHRLLRKP